MRGVVTFEKRGPEQDVNRAGIQRDAVAQSRLYADADQRHSLAKIDGHRRCIRRGCESFAREQIEPSGLVVQMHDMAAEKVVSEKTVSRVAVKKVDCLQGNVTRDDTADAHIGGDRVTECGMQPS